MAVETVRLRAGASGLDLVPAIGGGIAAYWTGTGEARRDWLRPATAAALAAGDPLGLGNFPLTPFSNRIREGRFRFQGREVALPLNTAAERHQLHGYGWQRPWRVLEQSATHCAIGYDHAADAWPFPYHARQDFTLSEAGLDLAISVENTGDTAMPAGLGQHLYFPRTPATTVTAGITGMWANDAEVMPLELVEPPPGKDLRRGFRPEDVRTDNTFTDWDRRAVIEWPERRAWIAIEAEAPLDFLVCYAPDDPYVCVEPVSNITDAFNLAEAGRTDTGTTVLQPGEVLRGVIRLRPEVVA
ncbi:MULTISPECIES: aldose 1-epimerase [Inquilinus]|uniref:Aldose 1-epimerase n=1 Tax=Inquilinus ginsengisoli TaxID=363840 RepID=A0ABU1JWN0_9PROT|nr:aldose 1-epimerase [Inquilinus ginsengisoli]MDR6291960.1 aldose 1-epimerase [Inquilinus ginsengisoli]